MTVLAAAAPAASSVVPGVLGFLVVAGMGLALFFLLRSMNKQLYKIAGGPRWRGKGKPGPPEGEVGDGQPRADAAAGRDAGTGRAGTRR